MIHSRIVAGFATLMLASQAFAAEERVWTETLERISSGVVYDHPGGTVRNRRGEDGRLCAGKAQGPE